MQLEEICGNAGGSGEVEVGRGSSDWEQPVATAVFAQILQIGLGSLQDVLSLGNAADEKMYWADRQKGFCTW